MMIRTISLLTALAAVISAGCGGDGDGSTSASTATDGTGGGGAGGAGGGGGGAGGGLSDAEIEALYQAAILDAKTAEPSEIVDTLVAINPNNAGLIRDASGRVLMSTWTSYPGYESHVGQEMILGEDVWTTPGRDLQDFCLKTGLSGEALALRLEQILGLPPKAGYDRMVELWVPVEGMFRPSPDPEITDSTAQLDFPPNTPQAHIDWINTLTATSYGPDGYPWTRLGYTYDWSPDAMSELGLSEIVIAKGTAVVVASVTVQDEYCLPKP
jgi:hypothetical protein